MKAGTKEWVANLCGTLRIKYYRTKYQLARWLLKGSQFYIVRIEYVGNRHYLVDSNGTWHRVGA